jgi:hypothetical protein
MQTFLISIILFVVCIGSCALALRSQLTAECLRQTLTRWAANVTDSTSTSTSKSLVYWCDSGTHCGGIGDRMRSVIDLFFWAVAMQRRFLVWMPKPVPLSDVLVPAAYNWSIEAKPTHCDLFWSQNVSRGSFPDLDASKYTEFNTICVHTSQFFHARAVRSRKDLFGAAFGDATVFEAQFFGEAFRFLFRPSPRIWSAMDELRIQAKLPALQWLRPQWVAVHFRTALGDDRERDSIADVHNITQCFVAAADALDWSGRPIFVASDSAAAKVQLLSTIPGATSATVHVIHVDADQADATSNHSNSIEHVFSAWAEFLLIAHSSCVVASRSGFSEWALKAGQTLGSVSCLIRWRQCETDLVQLRHNQHVDGSAFRFRWDAAEQTSKCAFNV